MKSKNEMKIEYSNFIKFIALLLMFCHHFFNEEWLLFDCKFTPILHVRRFTLEMVACDVGKICVAIFAFLTGYGLFFSFQKNSQFRKLVQRIVQFLLKFWFVLFTAFVPAYCMIRQTCDLKTIFLAMFGLESSVNMFSWYVYFYVISVIFLWIWHKINLLITAHIFQKCFNMIAFFSLAVPFINTSNAVLENLIIYLPTTLVGYTLAKYGLIDFIIAKIDCHITPKVQIVLGVLGGGTALLVRYGISMLTHWYIWNELDTIFALWIVLCIILVAKNLSLLTGFLALTGKATTNMWFLHAIFFGVYAEYTQKIAYWPHAFSALGVRHEKLGIKRRKEKLKFAKSFIKST